MRIAITLLLIFVATVVASAQNGRERLRFERGAVELSVLGGASIPVSWLRARPNRRLSMGSFSIGRVMSGNPRSGNFEMLVDVTPLFQIRQPDAAFGFAVSPLFLRWNFRPVADDRIRIFGEVSGGLLYTNHAVPVRTTTFNFLDQAGFGMRIEAGPRHAWLLGYRFQHISNGGRVRPNPGANFNFFYGGVSFVR